MCFSSGFSKFDNVLSKIRNSKVRKLPQIKMETFSWNIYIWPTNFAKYYFTKDPQNIIWWRFVII